MVSIIITHTGYQDQEVIYPYYRLLEEAAKGTINTPLIASDVGRGKVRGILGTDIESHLSLRSDDLSYSIDLLVLPGGVKAMEKLRQNGGVIDFIAEANRRGITIAAMCSGVQLLISAKVLKGRRVTIYPAFAVDVENAGAEYVDAPVVTDGNLVTSPHYRHLGEWVAEAIRVARDGK